MVHRSQIPWLVFATLGLLAIPPLGAGAAPGNTVTSAGRGAFPMTNVTYNASSDGFPLSYEEVLPAHFVRSHTYPLLVYLHGAGKTTAWTRGGSGNGLVGLVNNASLEGVTLEHLLANATQFGFIVIAPSPRSSQGFYTNSSCGGPEEQDTVDAIDHEEGLRHISSVYLLGDSMGSLGALSLAAHRPGLVQGIALTGTITDAFEEFAFHPSTKSSLVSLTCGKWPSATNATSQRTFAYLSVARLRPTNLSGVRIWVSAGSEDRDSPNNASIWPFEMVNYTFLNSSCLSARAYGEPANCTDPFAALHRVNATAYLYRFFYEPTGTHLIAQLDPEDMFEFFQAKIGGGCVETTFPPSTLRACP